MTCSEVRDQAPLYWSGEMEAAERARFTSHLAACPACEQEIDAQALADARVARVLGDLPDASRLEQRVRREIAAQRTRRWLAAGALAASLVAGMASIYALVRPAPVPRWYGAAARDHRLEVRDGQPRRWRTGAREIGAVAAEAGLNWEQASALAAAGYTLQRARICGLDGERMLHLVFSNGSRSYSVYLGRHAGSQAQVRTAGTGSEAVAGWETRRYRAAVVTEGPEAECAQLAAQLAPHTRYF